MKKILMDMTTSRPISSVIEINTSNQATLDESALLETVYIIKSLSIWNLTELKKAMHQNEMRSFRLKRSDDRSTKKLVKN